MKVEWVEIADFLDAFPIFDRDPPPSMVDETILAEGFKGAVDMNSGRVRTR